MRILIITDSYPPEVRSAAELMAGLAEGLHEKGHEVTVATTFPTYNLAGPVKKLPRDRVENGVRVLRVKTLPHHKVAYVLRGINQLLLPVFFTRAVKRMVGEHAALRPAQGRPEGFEGRPAPSFATATTGKQGKIFDFIIVHSPPVPLALAAGKLANHYGAQFIANIHDIFPQNGIDLVTAWQKPLIQFVFGGMERAIYRSADTLVVPSENHARYLREERAVPEGKITVIQHWIDTRPYDGARATGKWRKAWGLEGKFIFFFGGVLGPSQGLPMVLDAAESFRELPDVRFLFVGDGTARPGLLRIVHEKKLKNIIFKPFVSSDEYPGLVKEMDVAVATLTAKNTTPAVPAKLMGYMAAGVPVVLAVHAESDALRIVAEAHCGFVAVSDDRAAVIRAFRAAYESHAAEKIARAVGASLRDLGANGRRYLEEHFSKEKILPAWDALLRE